MEHTISWLGGLGRFRIRYVRDQQVIHAWNHLALAAFCYRILMRQPV
ncbi:hypothetical protein [Planctopirus ephydatiae]|nr:hypothetical protein [Planctopirus ephydatiae]